MNIQFFAQYVKNLRTIGAVAPSSRFLAEKMVSFIDFGHAKLIVQFGPGTGSFTDEILRRRTDETTIVLIEFNERFYQTLCKKYGHLPRLYVYNGSAEDVDGVLKQYGLPPKADYIVSGLPFASLPEKQSTAILDRARAIVGADGMFITFQYTLLKKGLLQNYFDTISTTREWRNIPPAYVLACTNPNASLLFATE